MRSNMKRSWRGLGWIASSLRSLAMTAKRYQQKTVRSRPPSASPHVRPLGFAPAPARHRLLFDLVRFRLRGDDGDARAPFDIGDERRAKFLVRRRVDFVRRVDQ